MPTEFVLPELGENVEKGDIVRVMVAVGDVIKKDQAVLELETDKATIEVPSSIAGQVTAVRVKPGDKVKVGQPVIAVEETASEAGAATGAPEATPEATQAAPAASASAQAKPADVTKPASKPAAVVDISRARPATGSPARVDTDVPVPAAPSVRRFARELGVPIDVIEGSGPGGRIGQEDVKEHVKASLAQPGTGGGLRQPPLPDFSKWGPVDVQPMTNIRRKTAEHLTLTWQAPHVTQHDKADMTGLEAFRKLYGPRVEKAGGAKLTVTVVLLKVISAALDRFPQFASSIDMTSHTLITKKYRHIGFAVDTPNGLLVPVIRDVDRKTLTELSVELAGLSKKAQDRKLNLEDMAGGVFTISNLGGIGGTLFTPLINPPEVAILGVSRGTIEPVWRDGAFAPAQMLPLSLSYDHRAVDGADAARFLRFIAEAIEHPLAIQI